MPTLKKYLKYALIVLAGIALVALWFAWQSWKKKTTGDGGMTKETETLKTVVTEIGAKMTEADQQATVEIAAARSEDAATKTKLAEIVKIGDKVERRQKLTDLYKQVKA